MYRYLLFYCPTYYPSGGIYDCELKTNNIDELAPFVDEHYNNNLLSSIHYYDTVEDRVYNAVMEDYEDNDYFTRQRFVKWKEATK